MLISEMHDLYAPKIESPDPLYIDYATIYCSGKDTMFACTQTFKKISSDAIILDAARRYVGASGRDPEIPVISVWKVKELKNWGCYLVSVWGIHAHHCLDNKLFFDFCNEQDVKISCHRLDIKLRSGLQGSGKEDFWKGDRLRHGHFAACQPAPVNNTAIYPRVHLDRGLDGMTSYVGTKQEGQVCFRICSNKYSRYFELEIRTPVARNFNWCLRSKNKAGFFYSVYKYYLEYTSEVIRIGLTEILFEKKRQLWAAEKLFYRESEQFKFDESQGQALSVNINSIYYEHKAILFSEKLFLEGTFKFTSNFRFYYCIYFLYFLKKVIPTGPMKLEPIVRDLNNLSVNSLQSLAVPVSGQFDFKATELLDMLGLAVRPENIVKVRKEFGKLKNLDIMFFVNDPKTNLVQSKLQKKKGKSKPEAGFLYVKSTSLIFEYEFKKLKDPSLEYDCSCTINLDIFSRFLDNFCSMPISYYKGFLSYIKNYRKPQDISGNLFVLLVLLYREIYAKKASINIWESYFFEVRPNQKKEFYINVKIVLDFLKGHKLVKAYSLTSRLPQFKSKKDLTFVSDLCAIKDPKEANIFLHYLKPGEFMPHP